MRVHRRQGRRRALAIFRAPLLIASATGAGLVAGLLGDGAWDLLAAVGLAVPVVAYLANDRAKG